MITNKKSFLRFFKFLYLKLFRINDTPQKKALGFSIGVFLGILPGTGPLAALFLAMLLRVNRAASLLGSLLTNTWLSFVTFALSVKIGSAILKVNRQAVLKAWGHFFKTFHLKDLLEISVLETILPVILGYLVIAFCLAVTTYLSALIIIYLKNKPKGN